MILVWMQFASEYVGCSQWILKAEICFLFFHSRMNGQVYYIVYMYIMGNSTIFCSSPREYIIITFFMRFFDNFLTYVHNCSIYFLI